MSVLGDLNKININRTSRSSPTRATHDVQAPMGPAPGEAPVTVTHLGASEDLQRQATEQQARFQRTSEQDVQGEQFSKSLKSGRDRIGGADQINLR